MVIKRGNLCLASNKKGFSLLELVVVFSLIAILFSLSLSRYQSSVSESQRAVIQYQASTFARAVENVRAISMIQKSAVVDMGSGLKIYLNSDGWPVATNANNNSQAQSVPSLDGCASLWHGLFREVSRKSSQFSESSIGRFEISLQEKDVCRYKLSRKQEGSFFFDYHVITGNVVITSVELN